MRFLQIFLFSLFLSSAEAPFMTSSSSSKLENEVLELLYGKKVILVRHNLVSWASELRERAKLVSWLEWFVKKKKTNIFIITWGRCAFMQLWTATDTLKIQDTTENTKNYYTSSSTHTIFVWIGKHLNGFNKSALAIYSCLSFKWHVLMTSLIFSELPKWKIIIKMKRPVFVILQQLGWKPQRNPNMASRTMPCQSQQLTWIVTIWQSKYF